MEMKKNILFILISCISVFAQNNQSENGTISYSYYHISAENLNLNIVNSYPQEIVKYISKEKPYEIVIKTHPAFYDVENRKLIEAQQFQNNSGLNVYPGDIEKYLEPTELIESDSQVLKIVADSLVNYKQSLVENIQKILKWVSANVKYDGELAKKISNGEIDTQSALKTLECKKGTCSEYTNLFIAIMRSLGIPTRFITGVILEKENLMYHAWAECYIKDIGWHGVDPQTSQFWVPEMGIKLFAGKDFIDCNINTLPDIKASVKKINGI